MAAALPTPRLLMGPGPCMAHPAVLEALGRAPLGHLDPELFETLARIQSGLRTVFGTQNEFTLALTGTGMAGMESCFANLVEPGDEVLIAVHGFFGERMVEMATRYGATVHRVEEAWGQSCDPQAIISAIHTTPNLKLVACVHAETSTGVRQDLTGIGAAAHEAGALFLVDTVTSLGGLPVGVDANEIDACYSATQKCMGCPSGLSPITVSTRAMEAVKSRKSKPSNWYLDWSLLDAYWHGAHAYHHTVPSSLLAGLDVSLRMIQEEGLEARFERHRRASGKLLEHLGPLGVTPLPAPEIRLPTLNAVCIPDGVDDAAVRSRLLTEYGIEIGGGFGALKGKIWRIGTMGESATTRNVLQLAAAIGESLKR